MKQYKLIDRVDTYSRLDVLEEVVNDAAAQGFELCERATSREQFVMVREVPDATD